MHPYCDSDLAQAGYATTFNRLFLASLHPDLHHQALGDTEREEKARAVSFQDLVQELRNVILDQVVGIVQRFRRILPTQSASRRPDSGPTYGILEAGTEIFWTGVGMQHGTQSAV